MLSSVAGVVTSLGVLGAGLLFVIDVAVGGEMQQQNNVSQLLYIQILENAKKDLETDLNTISHEVPSDRTEYEQKRYEALPDEIAAKQRQIDDEMEKLKQGD